MSSIEEKLKMIGNIPFFMIRAHKILKTGGRKNFTHTELLLKITMSLLASLAHKNKITMSLLASLAHKNKCGQLAYAYVSNKKFNELRMCASLVYAYCSTVLFMFYLTSVL